ncbi:MAG TPA: glycosyltransferase family 39 protein, partial [Chloroflexota bacterium]|nr:glycosyltransferase family 39 protein [Chloroflexota bacterium]
MSQDQARGGALLAPLAIGVVAAFLRLWQHDLTPFLDDETRLLAASAQFLATHQIPLTSGFPTSIHVNEPPLAAVLTAIPMLVSGNPGWVSGFLALMDALAAVLVYLAAKEVAGTRAAVAAGLLYAVSPAAIYFSRRIEYAALVPVLVALSLLMCVRAWKGVSPVALAIALVAAACAVELHASAAAVLIVWLVVALAVARKLPSYGPVIVGAGVVATTLAPYVYLQATTNWSDVAAGIGFLRAAKQTDLTGPEIAGNLIGGGIFHQLLLPRGTPEPAVWLDPAGWLLLALVLAGVAISVRCRNARPAAGLVIVAALITIRHAAGILPYYMVVVLPAAAVLAGLAVAVIRPRIVAGLLLAFIVAWQIASYVHFQTGVAAEGPDLEAGMPLRYEAAAAEALPRLAPGSRLYIAQEGNQQFSFDYLSGERYRVTNSDSRYGISLPLTAPAQYLVQPGGPPYDFLAQAFGPPGKVISTSAGRPAFGLFEVKTSAAEMLSHLPNFQPTLANFGDLVQVLGYSGGDLRGGQPSPVVVAWKVLNPNAPLPSDIQQYAHLVGNDGVNWSTNPDERAYPVSSWQIGDVVLTWFQLAPPASIPTGGYWLETGFYGYPAAEPLPLLGPQGVTGTTLRLGPVRVAGAQREADGSPQAVFGGRLALVGVQRNGDNVTLTWQARQKPSNDYTVFVHLLNAAGDVVAQHDGPPQGGSYPTTLWRAGDVVTDVHQLVGGADGVTLEVGLYARPSLQRLQAVARDGTALGDH